MEYNNWKYKIQVFFNRFKTKLFPKNKPELTIITPYYNCLEYTQELAKALEPQLDDRVEWIIIDDGCNEIELENINAKVFHLKENSGCAGIPRNVGLDFARGDFINFIDADDMVSNDYIKQIFDKIYTEDFDYCLMSWRTEATRPTYVDISHGRPSWNCSVWGIVYKKETIGDNRFGNMRIAEDYNFNMNTLKGAMATIPAFLYTYRQNESGITATARKEQ